MLKRRGVKVELLNAKPEYAAREAEIIAQAGRINAVTISTNMAGRGTDIILGGNAEFLAWAKLKEQFASRLDVPPDVWKKTVDEIEAKEDLKAEGRRVAHMGGLHVVGTERHEARRIDNQLRGRGGRQGDPGSSRFYLSLQDDLMRIFAGEWVANFLRSVGMEEGQAIESRMVSRRIAAAQKKVEERNFDIRRNLLEFDEVMDHQRKTVYGYRQDILEGNNCKLLTLRMLDEQIETNIGEFLDRDYGVASFAEYASKRLSHEFQAGDFARMDYIQAERYAHEKASKSIEPQVLDIIEENLGNDVDQKEWNWQAAAKQISSRWGIKMSERDLKKIGRDNLAQHLIIEANKIVEQVDLEGGKHFLDPDWGLKSACDWVRLKFQINLQVDDLREKTPEEMTQIVFDKVKTLYHDKDVEFPVRLGMARFMSERPVHGHAPGSRYDRDGLLHWTKERFPHFTEVVSEEEFHTESRPKLQEKLTEVSRRFFPKLSETEMDNNLQDAFEGEVVLSEETAQEFAGWLKTEADLDISVEDLAGLELDDVRQLLWNAYDLKYRPEMRRMERSLLLTHLDSSWKNHLYIMDHLRQGIGLVGYAQEDPKTAYKREGMKEFDGMWRGVRDKVSDTIFRMEEAEGFQESVWSISEARHDQAGPAMQAPPEGSIQAQQMAAIQSSQQQSEKKPEPIRNRGQRVGRNDPCPCGSGKKYKNCCMRTTVG
jgi:preprotein translocase subunit SecA